LTLNGKLTSRAIESFLAKGLPNAFKKISTEEELQSSVFDLSNRTVIVISEKESISMAFRTLAIGYKSKLNFAFVHSGASEVVTLLNTSQFPTVGSYFSGEWVTYTGDVKDRSAVDAWLRSLVANSPASDEDDAATESATIIHLKDLFPQTPESPTDIAHVVAVVNADATSEIAGWANRGASEGRVRIAELRCKDEDPSHDDYDSVCLSTTNKVPYLLSLPFGASERKKVRKHCRLAVLILDKIWLLPFRLLWL
jgi:hypothetical protein